MTFSYLNGIAKTGVALTVAAGLMAGAANAEFTSVDPITKTFEIEGQSTTLTIHPEFAVSGENGSIKVDLSAVIDASNLQGDLTALMNKRWSHEECGERFSTHSASVTPAGNGRLHVGLTAQAQKWECGGTKVPKTYCKDTWIKVFGLKTKGIPKCTVKWEQSRWKTKLISQSIRVEALAYPVIKGDTITAEVNVTKAMPSGLAKHLVNAFGLHGKVKDLVQRKIDEKVRGQQFRLPKELQAYNVVIDGADFMDLGGGRLGLKLLASGLITQAQLAELINEQISKVN